MTDNRDSIINAGLKAEISRRMGFDASKVVLLESSERDGFPINVAFEVCGQGYSWDILNDAFRTAPEYGDAIFRTE